MLCQIKCFQSMILNMVLTFCLKLKIRKKIPLGKNILLLDIYNFENIFCIFLMVKKRQECSNSTVYRTRIENILATQFEVFFFEKSSWLVKLKNSIKNAILPDIFPYFMHILGTFIISSIISHPTQNTVWHSKSNKTYFFQYFFSK